MLPVCLAVFICLWFKKKRERESIIDWGGAWLPRQLNWLPVLFQCQPDALLNLLDHLWRVVSMTYDLFKALMTQNIRIVSSPPGWSVTGSPKTEDLQRHIWARPSSVLWSGVYTPGLRDNVLSVSLCPCQHQSRASAGLPGALCGWSVPLGWQLPLQLGPPSFIFLLHSFQAIVHSPGLWGHILFIFVMLSST